MAIIMNFTVVVVYWGFLHKIDPVKWKNRSWLRNYNKYFVHIFPGIACLLNTLVTDTVLKPRLWIVIAFISVVYHINNFLVVKVGNHVMYKMLNFQDGIKSWLWAFGLSTSACLVYLILCKIDFYYKVVRV